MTAEQQKYTTLPCRICMTVITRCVLIVHSELTKNWSIIVKFYLTLYYSDIAVLHITAKIQFIWSIMS